MEPADILKMPCFRQVIPQPDGIVKAEILEFPGCFAIGDTAPAALIELENIAVDWIKAALAQGQSIPEPTESASYSGKFVTRMSKTLHKKAAQFALRDGVSLNQFVVNCVAEHVGMLSRPLTIYAQPLQVSGHFAIRTGSGTWMPIGTSGGILLPPPVATVTTGKQSFWEKADA